jgi:sirohydrochlorin cobaltochelatase
MISGGSFAMGKGEDKKAIVLASFGTSYLSALKSITTIEDNVKKSFPGATVRVAFTSNIIRKIWHKRRCETKFMREHGAQYSEFLDIKGVLATIADLQDEGYNTIVVQSTHVYSGEEFADLASYIEGLNTIKTIKAKYMPFKKLVLGRPALGTYGIIHDYHDDLKIGAEALAADVEFARKNGGALVYMGHGNEYFSTGIYIEFQQVMRKMYPDVKIYVGTVEGYPSLDDVLNELKGDKIKKVVLKPMMVVAGDHANNDMAGEEDDSWKSEIKKIGIDVVPVLKGLGESGKWSDIYIQHIKDAIKDNAVDF